MPRRSIIAPTLTAIALALLGGTAQAKEVQQVLACGASGCTDATDRVHRDDRMLQTGAIDDGPRGGAPFFRIRYSVGDGSGQAHDGWAVLYVPSENLIGVYDQSVGRRFWYRTTPESRSEYRKAVRGIEPLPAARLPLPKPDEANQPSGALPPEVIEAPTVAPDRDSGLSTWGLVALIAGAAGLVSALILVTRRAIARRRRGGGSVSLGPEPAP